MSHDDVKLWSNNKSIHTPWMTSNWPSLYTSVSHSHSSDVGQQFLLYVPLSALQTKYIYRRWVILDTWHFFQHRQSNPAVSEQWRKPGVEFGGTEKIFADQDDVFFLKNFHFGGKTFFSHRPGFSKFPSLFPDVPDLYTFLDIYTTLSSQEKHLFYSFHTFAHIRQHYFSKHWGDECMGRSPTSNFGGGPSPQSP